MSTRKTGLAWVKSHDPSEAGDIYVSKHYAREKMWFFTLPAAYLAKANKHKLLKLLCQHESYPKIFYYLKIPFSFLYDMRGRFDKDKAGEKFDLHISSKMENRFHEEKSENFVKFGRFVKYR